MGLGIFRKSDEYMNAYYQYSELTKRLKQEIEKLEKLGYYAKKENFKGFLKVFIVIESLQKLIIERESVFEKLKGLYQTSSNATVLNIENKRAKTNSNAYTKMMDCITDEREVEYRNGFRSLLENLTNGKYSKINENIPIANILLSDTDIK